MARSSRSSELMRARGLYDARVGTRTFRPSGTPRTKEKKMPSLHHLRQGAPPVASPSKEINMPWQPTCTPNGDSKVRES